MTWMSSMHNEISIAMLRNLDVLAGPITTLVELCRVLLRPRFVLQGFRSESSYTKDFTDIAREA